MSVSPVPKPLLRVTRDRFLELLNCEKRPLRSLQSIGWKIAVPFQRHDSETRSRY